MRWNNCSQVLVFAVLSAVTVATPANADPTGYRDLRGRLSIEATPEWAFNLDGKGGAEIECNFGACRQLTSSMRSKVCAIHANYGQAGVYDGDRLERAAADSFKQLIEKLSAQIGPMAPDGAPTRAKLANGDWMTVKISGQSRRTGAKYTGAAWMAGRGDTAAVIFCIFTAFQWPTLAPRLQALVSSAVWSGPTC